jgi:choline dehydrogenase-like flavoprotein
MPICAEDDMQTQKYDFVIVGSGAGGATLARELSRKGRRVLVVERGRHETKVGTLADSLRYYDLHKVTKMPRTSREGVQLWQAFMAGGSTAVAAGNGTRCLERELAEFGIHLEDELAEVERELDIHPLDEGLLSEGSLVIRQAASELGYNMEPMPKFVDPVKCRRDGVCTWGCPCGAKWSALEYLQEAQANGAEVLFDIRIDSVTIEHGRARGVVGAGPEGRAMIAADTVILAAGGLGTPLILQQSGIAEAGAGLFADLFIRTYGVTSGPNLVHEPNMALVDMEFYADQGFILSPNAELSRTSRLVSMGPNGFALPTSRLLAIMTKIRDEAVGHVYRDGSVSKPVTDKDREKLEAGARVSRQILIKAGADPRSIVDSKTGGAHPGGTAAIGRIVDTSLRTRVEGLFVCDGSVLPVAPGLPPIVTIVALAKRLAHQLVA